MRRVVVTGMGIVCPLGLGVEHVWQRLINSASGISSIQSFDTTNLPAKIAGQVPAGTRAEGGLDLSEWVPPELVFDVIAAPYLGRTPRALRGKLEVIERGADLVLAAHFTPVAPGLTVTTLEIVRFAIRAALPLP